MDQILSDAKNLQGASGRCTVKVGKDFIQAANVVKNLDVLVDNSFSHPIHCKEAASKARRMLFMIRRSFAEISVSAFAPLFYNTLVRSHFVYAM